MRTIPYFHIDAFANQPFMGNPASVCLLEEWLDDNQLAAIANELNLPATAFIVNNGQTLEIRWFDTLGEKSSCGHATLAAAFVLFNETQQSSIKLINHGNEIHVTKDSSGLISLTVDSLDMRFAAPPKPLTQAMDLIINEVYQTDEQYIVITKNAQRIKELQPDWQKLQALDKRALIITAPDDISDFVFRYFRPHAAEKEDAITGTAIYLLAPYWAKTLNKSKLLAKQLSARGTSIPVTYERSKVKISGYAKLFARGELLLAEYE